MIDMVFEALAGVGLQLRNPIAGDRERADCVRLNMRSAENTEGICTDQGAIRVAIVQLCRLRDESFAGRIG